MYNEIIHQDKILLPEMRFRARHGVLDEERMQEQDFLLAVELVCDLAAAGESDKLADTLDYGVLYAKVENIMLGEPHNLLESLASDIAYALLADELVQSVTVRLEKCSAPLAGGIRAAVEITRTGADYAF